MPTVATSSERRLAIPGKSKPYVLAHRGNQVVCPENTLAAFRQAVADGADIVETDIHRTSDGAFVCIHDPTVDRTTDGSGEVAEMTLAALKALSAACGRPEFCAERVPTLAELAAAVPDDVFLALELKSDCFLETAVCRKLVVELDRAGARKRTLFLSFSDERLRAVRSVAPDIPIGSITHCNPWPLMGADLLGPYWPLILLNPLYVWLAHRRGRAVCPLDPAPAARLGLYRWLGCDAVLTNDSGATCRALKRARR
jgi:glycerophosphoryl diester phosphodiesterase